MVALCAVQRLKAEYAAVCAAVEADVREKYCGFIHMRLRRKRKDGVNMKQVEVFIVAHKRSWPQFAKGAWFADNEETAAWVEFAVQVAIRRMHVNK
jgi:hypothetical protein